MILNLCNEGHEKWKHLPDADEKYLTAPHWPNDSVLAINNSSAVACACPSKRLAAIQTVRTPPFLFKCSLMLDSNQYLKAEFRTDKTTMSCALSQ